MFIFPQSTEEDTPSVSIVGWIVNRRIDCCIRIVGLSRMVFWDWDDSRFVPNSSWPQSHCT
jgi:hypothetical protein